VSFTIYDDGNLRIKGTSNGYYVIGLTDDTSGETTSVDVDDPVYFLRLSKAFELAAYLLREELK
jgi:hypothetical protein